MEKFTSGQKNIILVMLQVLVWIRVQIKIFIFFMIIYLIYIQMNIDWNHKVIIEEIYFYYLSIVIASY